MAISTEKKYKENGTKIAISVKNGGNSPQKDLYVLFIQFFTLDNPIFEKTT